MCPNQKISIIMKSLIFNDEIDNDNNKIDTDNIKNVTTLMMMMMMMTSKAKKCI